MTTLFLLIKSFLNAIVITKTLMAGYSIFCHQISQLWSFIMKYALVYYLPIISIEVLRVTQHDLTIIYGAASALHIIGSLDHPMDSKLIPIPFLTVCSSNNQSGPIAEVFFSEDFIKYIFLAEGGNGFIINSGTPEAFSPLISVLDPYFDIHRIMEDQELKKKLLKINIVDSKSRQMIDDFVKNAKKTFVLLKKINYFNLGLKWGQLDLICLFGMIVSGFVYLVCSSTP